LIQVADRNPEQVAWDEAKGAALTLWRLAVDQGRRYLTASLLKFMLAGVIAIGLAGYSLPAAAVALTVAAVAGGLIYGVYGQRIAHDERASRRWTWIAAKRLQQDKLRMEQRLDAAVFDVLGRSAQANLGAAHSSPELRQAIATVRFQAAEAQRQKLPGTAEQHARHPGPEFSDLNRLRARMAARKADIDALEAEIQSLAVPENADAAMAAEEARNHEKSLADSARKADQEARNRVRRGQSATQSEPGVALQIQMGPTGTRDVKQVVAPIAPEQIARGQRDTDDAAQRDGSL
jgi:hypothetical protein